MMTIVLRAVLMMTMNLNFCSMISYVKAKVKWPSQKDGYFSTASPH